MKPELANRFRDIVGPRGLITSAEELRTYECDGLTNFRVMPISRSPSRKHRASASDSENLPRGENSVRRARFRHRTQRRRAARRQWNRHQPDAHESHPRNRHSKRARRRRTRRNQSRRHRPAFRRRSISTRPIRRRNRCAVSAATSPKIPAARIASNTDSRQPTCSASKSFCLTDRSCISAANRSTRPATISPEFSSAPKARSASPQKSFCAS